MGLPELLDQDVEKDNKVADSDGIIIFGGEDIKCPGCGSTNTEKVNYYYRCNEDRQDCEVTTFIKGDQ